MKKEDIKIPELQNVEVDVEKLPKAMRDIIAKQGEESFLRTVAGLIKKHTRVTFDSSSKSVSLSIAGINIFTQEFK